MNIKLGQKEFNISKNGAIAFIIILLIIIIIFSTNKKENLLVCNRVNSNVTVDAEEKYTAKFENGNLSELKMHYKQTLKPDYRYMLDEVYDNFNGQQIELKNGGGYDYTINKGSNYVVYDAVANINEIPDSSKVIIGYNNTWKYKDVKADLERNEFKCK